MAEKRRDLKPKVTLFDTSFFHSMPSPEDTGPLGALEHSDLLV